MHNIRLATGEGPTEVTGFFVDADRVLRFASKDGQGMTKADLAHMVYERHGNMTNRDAARFVDLVFDLIKQHLLEGESIHIVGFGTLEVVSRKPRPGRNPITGERIELAARRALVFRPSRSMRSV